MKHRALRRRYGRAGASGWASGQRPSHAAMWTGGKPLEIRKTGSKWAVYVMGEPVVKAVGGLTFRGRADFDAMASVAPIAKFSKGDAQHVAHKIGHYMLGLGDFAYSYVEGW
jgi:hypothetical protein